MISKYQVFMKVVETKSITKAAEILGYTQSGVSHIIKNMEEDFGLQLFIRKKQNITLTPSGENLIEPISRIASWEQVLKDKVDSMNGISDGDLRIGTFCSVSVNWMPYIIKKYHEQYPNIRFHLLDNDHDTAEELLLNYKLDCAFIPPPISKELTYIPLYQDLYYAVLPKTDEFIGLQDVPLSLFTEIPFIVPCEGMNYNLGKLFAGHNIVPNMQYSEKDDFGTLTLVRSGLGGTILNEMLLNCYPNDDFLVLPLSEECYRPFGFAFLSDMQLNPIVRTFMSTVLEWTSEHI